jgi:sporulation protein YlmC with PRC-barrel domain
MPQGIHVKVKRRVKMKRSILRALALCLAMTVAVTCARAQATSGTSSGTGTGAGTKSPQGAPPTSSGTYSPGTQTSSPSSATAAGQSVRLSKLMNTSLRGQTGESLGQVQDVILDPTSGQAQFVVLSLNSSAAGAPGAGASTTPGTRSTDTSVSSPRSAPSGVGSYGTITGSGKLVAIPWRLVSYGAGDQFSAMVDRTKLESAPTFSATAWPTMDSAWMQRVYSHFGVEATGAPGTGTGTGRGTINPSTPGLPSTPGAPDITPPPNANPSTTPGTTPGTAPGTTPGTSPSGAPGAK